MAIKIEELIKSGRTLDKHYEVGNSARSKIGNT